MKPRRHIHEPNDGRGNREVLLNGKVITSVIYADTKKGFVRVLHSPIRLDKYRKRVLWKTLRGRVEVRDYRDTYEKS